MHFRGRPPFLEGNSLSKWAIQNSFLTVVWSQWTPRNDWRHIWKPPFTSSYNSSKFSSFASRYLFRSPNSPICVYSESRCNQGKAIDFISRRLFASLGIWGLGNSHCFGTVWLYLIYVSVVMKKTKTNVKAPEGRKALTIEGGRCPQSSVPKMGLL